MAQLLKKTKAIVFVIIREASGTAFAQDFDGVLAPAETRIRRWLFALMVGLLLTGMEQASAATITRGPYLQMASSSSIVVRWRSDVATDSVVRYGDAPGNLTSSASSATPTTEHEVVLTGLLPETRHYYSVGSSGQTLSGGDTGHFFATAPIPGTAKPTRIWVLGDSGTGDEHARAVRDAYKIFTGAAVTDLMLMLGDNAYPDGTQDDYQRAVFETYPELLRKVVLWPSIGNHDGVSTANPSGPYFDMFTLPTNGEAGGIASGTEAYYSFDYGNIHFIVLETSSGADRSASGPMVTWLESDLAANDKPWTIAYWHHPPYSKGKFDSDTSSKARDMRENVLPLLELHGIDLVLAGHGHNYERSHLLDGHYGTSDTLTSDMILDADGGRVDRNGAYGKEAGMTNDGAVYVVAGSSSRVTGSGTLDHPAMFISSRSLGSMVLDINDNRLDAIFLDSGGNVADYFTIVKAPDSTPPILISAQVDDASTVRVTFSETLDQASAEIATNYTIDNKVSVTQATLSADGQSAVLDISPLIDRVIHTLTVNNVADPAGNFIAANSQTQFILGRQFQGPRRWITASDTRRVYEIPLNGGAPLRSFKSPENARSGLAVDPNDDTLWAASEPKLDTIFGSIVNFAKDGSTLTEIGADLFGGLGIEGVAVDYFDGTLWVVDDPIGVFLDVVPFVHQIAKDGWPIDSFPASNFDSEAQSMQAIAADPFDGTLWVTDNSTDTIYNIDRDGTLITSFRVKVYDKLASNPQGISVDETNGTLWVTDRISHRIYNITRTGSLISYSDSAEYDAESANPTAIAFDGRGATTMLRGAIADLQATVDALPLDVSGDDKSDRDDILDAIEDIGKSLKSKQWLDKWTPHPKTKVGGKVFEKNKRATEKLLEVKNNYGVTDVSGIIDELVNISFGLALATYDKATAESREACDADAISDACTKAKDKIADSVKKFVEARKELDKNEPHDAIKKYKDAWKKAQEAIKKANPDNVKPVAYGDTLSIGVDQAIWFQLTGYDSDGDNLFFVLNKLPKHGALVLNNASGVGLFTPNPGFVGDDKFEFRANDGILDSDKREVKFKVGK